jgi:ankyrin repeat protein/predicted membrane protein DUF2207
MELMPRTASATKQVGIGCVVGLLFWAGVGRAETNDRIVTFDSKLTVFKNRIVAIRERFEIVDDGGFFGGGFHRRLRIKGITPVREKAGSFEDIQAKIDGQDAQVQTSRHDSVFDIGVSTGKKWGRGRHVVEIEYTAKNQFALGSNEDLNRDVSGEWPVTIERATVELNFPSGVPPGADFSADIGTDTDFNSDCLQTDLPFGVKFEAPHPIAPNQGLFVYATFQPGYFVSEVGEGKIATRLEKQTWLHFLEMALLGLILFTAIAYLCSPSGAPEYRVAPRWIRLLVIISLPGTAGLTLRLVYEQTVMTWREGEQMVGFALAHAHVFLMILLQLSSFTAYLGLLLVLSVSIGRWLKGLPTPKWNWVPLGALCFCLGLGYVPYDTWMATTVRIAGPGKHGASFLMSAAGGGMLPLAKALVGRGVPPNTAAGGSTALDVACASRNLEVAKYLFSQGADISRAPSCARIWILPQTGK